MKDVTRENFERSEKALKKQAEELANKVAPVEVPVEIKEVEADLKDFYLTDNLDYLSVSHPALHYSVIGVVSKNEYSKGNKEAILRSVLESKFAEYQNTHSLKIVGSFVEPKINSPYLNKEEVMKIANWQDHLQNVYSGNFEEFENYSEVYNLAQRLGFSNPEEAWEANPVVQGSTNPADYKVVAAEKQIEPAKEITSDLPLLRSADSFRQNVETVAFRAQDKLDKFVASATNGLVSHLQSLKYDMPKITEVDASKLTENGESFNGFITASVSLENSTGPKYLNLPITISASKVIYPNEKETADFVSKGIDVMSKLEEKLALETLTAMAKVDAEEEWMKENISNIISEQAAEIKKVASDYTDGISSTNPGSHIKLQKHLLPGELADWEVGSTIYSDGKKWKLVSKGDGIDSNDKNAGSASLWDFVECLPEEGDDKVKADIPR
jgi:hypothetical protein